MASKKTLKRPSSVTLNETQAKRRKLNENEEKESDTEVQSFNKMKQKFLKAIRPPKSSAKAYDADLDALSTFSMYLNWDKCSCSGSENLDYFYEGDILRFLGYFSIRKCIMSSSERVQCAKTMKKFYVWLAKENYIKKETLSKVKNMCRRAVRDHANIEILEKKLDRMKWSRLDCFNEESREVRELKRRHDDIQQKLASTENQSDLAQQMAALQARALEEFGIAANDLVCV